MKLKTKNLFNRLPRKLKKELKRKYKHRYGSDFLKCDNLISEYYWFYKNPLNWDMNIKIVNTYGQRKN